jgi:hypothetical protein
MIDTHDPAQSDAASKAVGRAIYNITDGGKFVIEFTTIAELVREADRAAELMWPNVPVFETLE